MTLALGKVAPSIGYEAIASNGGQQATRGCLVHRRMVIPVIAALALAVSTTGLSATPATAAKWVDGWYTFYGTRTMTQAFSERTPAKSRVVIKLQKKRGTQMCRAQIVVRKGGAVSKSQQLYKFSRQQWAWYGTDIEWPNRARKTTVSVRTNGDCQYRIWVK